MSGLKSDTDTDRPGQFPEPTSVRRDLESASCGFLKPLQNVWRVERVRRAAVLIDAGQFYGALREALLKARRTVFILAWDIDSRTRLVDESGKTDDGLPEEFIPFLSALVRRRKELVVHILGWDYSILYAPEREFFSLVPLRWSIPRRVRFCLADHLPIGASHHQKVIVIDDALAFVGGLDVTSRRWDTREHRIIHPMRVDFSGAPYPPFHDVQLMLDGPAAMALGDAVRER